MQTKMPFLLVEKSKDGMISRCKGLSRSRRWQACLAVIILFLAGCPASTPAERLKQLGAKISDRGNGVVDIDLSGCKVNDNDVAYIHGFCSNSGQRWKAIHTLDLSNTSISDKAIEQMVLQSPFCPPDGLSVLMIKDTAVTDEAVEKFKNKFPNCVVRN